MSTPTPTTAPTGPSFTTAEAQLLLAVFRHGPRPNPDWNAVASEIGSASAASVRERFRVFCKKHDVSAGASAGVADMTPAATPKAKRTRAPIARKRKIDSVSGGDDAKKDDGGGGGGAAVKRKQIKRGVCAINTPSPAMDMGDDEDAEGEEDTDLF